MRHSHARFFLQFLALVPAILALVGCGSGTVAIIGAASGDGGGASNEPTRVNDLWVEDPDRESPGAIKFILSDRESDPADVSLFVIPATGAPEEPIPGAILRRLATAADGKTHSFQWSYAARFGDGYTADANLGIRVLSNPDVPAQGEYDRRSAAPLGNDEPAVTAIIVPEEEVAGIALVQFKTTDSSSDLLRIKVEYETDDGASGLATPGGASLDTDGYLDVEFRPGREPVYVWDVIADLGESEHDVTVTLTARDALLEGAPVSSSPFRVDNNLKPVVIPDVAGVLGNPDDRAGIPLPFEVQDEEGDEVGLLFQWRRPDENYDDEGLNDPKRIAEILADPELRREKKICTERPLHYGGRVMLVDAGHDPEGRCVRLPELGSSAAGLLGSGGIVGRELEILRDPIPAKAIDGAGLLASPVGVLAVDGGSSALVLDGAWRLREIDLATGVVEEIVSGQGAADALAYEQGERSVLVATSLNDGVVWRVYRVDLKDEDPVTELLVSSEGSNVEQGRIRGLASLSRASAVATVGSSLVELQYRPGEDPRAVTLVSGLATPWGVVKDPLHPHRVYVAERDWVNPNNGMVEGRVVALDLNSHGIVPVTKCDGPLAEAASGPKVVAGGLLPRPRALGLEHSGTRLLAVTDARGDDFLELRGVDLLYGDAEPFEVMSGLRGERLGLATGEGGLRLVSVDTSNETWAGGGVAQRRRIESYKSSTFTVTVAARFDPPLSPRNCWRIADSCAKVVASPGGREELFVSDSRDVPQGGEVLFRIIPFDADAGLPQEYNMPPKRVSRVDYDWHKVLGDSEMGGPRSVCVADLDGDGDLDLVSANLASDNITLFFQTSPGEFEPDPDNPVTDPSIDSPFCVAAADLDGDGDNDLVSGNVPRNLTVLFQTSPGEFEPDPDNPLTDPAMDWPFSVVAADLDGDGNLDLASANYYSDNLTLFFQTSPGTFEPDPENPVTDPALNRPWSVSAADLDRDGDLDLVSANIFSDNLTLFFQTSPGTFEPDPDNPLTDPAMLAPRFVTAADLDGDGDLDLVSANPGATSLTLFFQTSPGTFEPDPHNPLTDPGMFGPESVAVADLDGDGDLDLVSANSESDNLTVFLQTSPGIFESDPGNPLTDPAMDGPFSVAAADLDGDGDLDLVSANSGSDNLTVFLQTSPGIFESDPENPLTDPAMDGPFSVAAADLDGDGDLDLVSANVRSDNLTLFFQARPGIFEPDPNNPQTDPAMDAPFFVAPADLDGDGDVDLVSANSESDDLTVFFQTSPGIFEPHPNNPHTDPAVDGPVSVSAADLDGDGDMDVVSANAESSNLTIFFGNH
ncbi:MAG: VCBS repeat-containing protein [Planctomycetota bacterium]